METLNVSKTGDHVGAPCRPPANGQDVLREPSVLSTMTAKKAFGEISPARAVSTLDAVRQNRDR